LKQFVLTIDKELAFFIHRNIKNPTLDKILSKLNKGEFFLVITLIILIITRSDWYLALIYVSVFAFLNDRFVLFIKKRVSRKRPSLKLLGNTFVHEDLNHSFPSAHAANSLCVAILLINCYDQSNLFYLASFFAGVGRLCSLHHFLSDVIGGWMIGFLTGLFGIFIYRSILIFI